MKKLVLFSVLLFFLSILISWKKSYSPYRALHPWILSELKATNQEIENCLSHLNNQKKLEGHYRECRKHYKHLEFFIEFCSPREAKYFINGPLVPKHDVDLGNEVFAPKGFQKIEELIFSKEGFSDNTELEKELRDLKKQFLDIETYYETLELPDELILEMCQIQLYRMASLNLNGYDATITKSNVLESACSLEGMEKVLESFKPLVKESNGMLKYKQTIQRLKSSKLLLNKNPSFESFDRLNFIVDNINPLYADIIDIHKICGLPWNNRKQALNLQKRSPFSKEAINLQFFSMYYDDTLNSEKQAQLGKMLFFDPILSESNQRSCASCHNPSIAFTDGLVNNRSLNSEGRIIRNTPSLIDVCLQKSFFYDGRAYQLEQQIFDVVHNKTEMGGNLEELAVKLRESDEYRYLFKEAFKGLGDTIITSYAIQKTISEYEKTLVSFNSKFDNYLTGNRAALTNREINGYNLFAGKAQCGSCHFLPVFNGTVPPSFIDSEFEVLGVPQENKNQIDGDSGRFLVTKVKAHLNAFKTPTIRNIEYTAPYMHNGIYKSLEEVMEFYHKGGGEGLGYSVPNQTLPFDSLKLSQKETEDIIFFMRALNDTVGLTSRPSKLPIINGRVYSGVIGSQY